MQERRVFPKKIYKNPDPFKSPYTWLPPPGISLAAAVETLYLSPG